MEIDIKHIAQLSRLRIDEEDIDRVAREMIEIIASVENLPDLDASGTLIDPDHPMTMRPDEPKQTCRREDILRCAPQMQAGCVVVPKTID